MGKRDKETRHANPLSSHLTVRAQKGEGEKRGKKKKTLFALHKGGKGEKQRNRLSLPSSPKIGKEKEKRKGAFHSLPVLRHGEERSEGKGKNNKS